MALLNCPECGGQVSDKAGGCPRCGCPAESAMPEPPLRPGASMPRFHLFWLPAMLAALGVYALVPLHIGKLWFALPLGLALFSGLMALFALIGTRTSLLEKASDVAW